MRNTSIMLIAGLAVCGGSLLAQHVATPRPQPRVIQTQAACPEQEGYERQAGRRLHRPTGCPTPPPAAMAQCRDGSFDRHQGSRACALRGGVSSWVYR